MQIRMCPQRSGKTSAVLAAMWKPDAILMDMEATPMTEQDARRAVQSGQMVVAVHPMQYLQLQLMKFGGLPLQIARWEERISALRHQPKPRLP